MRENCTPNIRKNAFLNKLKVFLFTFFNILIVNISLKLGISQLLKLGISQLGPNSYLKKINKALHLKKI
jgi:hypothetical protein